ncbi:MAG: hypothetical protein JNM78_10830 [Cyclobacteriaceae bacterium]|nr:hypothetical protein [Cyclobacteriaceae bacterium]
MFRYESEMIPVLVDSLSKFYNTKYITTEFGTGNGVADLVFTTEMSEENLFLNDYGQMALFINLFDQNKTITTDYLEEKQYDKTRLKRLLKQLEFEDYICIKDLKIRRNRKYKGHTQNLISVEAKLQDWKSGFYQALRYKFFSHKSYLAYPKQNIHRVDIDLLREHNIGLISVDVETIEFVFKPKVEKPLDKVSYFFLSEMFAQQFKKTGSKVEVNC